MEFTGERFLPEVHGNIELEHLHRYLFACKLVEGKSVLDIASGEGYGSALLAQTAYKVTGVDISQEAILHAQAKYQIKSLDFRLGSCSAIPLEDASVDVVVSFETIEHHDEHEAMMQEIKRVLRPGGVLVISSPDKLEYSEKPGISNPYHVKELYRDAFIKLLDLHFLNHSLSGQRVVYGSAIFSEDRIGPVESYELVDDALSVIPGVSRAVYLVAVASDAELPCLSNGVLEQRIEDTELTRFWRELMAERDGQILNLTKAIDERDGQIVGLNQTIVERDGQLLNLTQTIVERDGQLLNLIQTIGERDGQIVGLNRTMGERDGQIVSLNQTIGERDGQLLNLTQTIGERDGQIVGLNQTIGERDGQIFGLNQTIDERDGQIVGLNQTIDERDGQILNLTQTIAWLDGQIVNLTQTISERDGQIVNLTQTISERDGQIVGFNQTIAECEWHMAELRAEIVRHEERALRQDQLLRIAGEQYAQIVSSSSWRISLPIREIKRFFIFSPEQQAKRYVSLSMRLVRRLYQTLPLSSQIKQTHRNSLAKYMPSLLLASGCHPDVIPKRVISVTKQEMPELALAVEDEAMPELALAVEDEAMPELALAVEDEAMPELVLAVEDEAMPELALAVEDEAMPELALAVEDEAMQKLIVTLPSADGTWEWSDYSVVKSNISQIRAYQFSDVSPSPLDLIDIETESFISVASRVKLPFFISAPEVSIILPVFNNLKLTLECLLSIATYTDPRVSYEVIMADDASTDETEQVIGSIPNLRVIRNDSNLGFLRNCNNALKHVQGNYVLYLNNDVQVTSGWLSSLLDTFNAHPNVGAVGPRFVYPSGHLQEAGAAFRPDGTADMIGLNGDPSQARFSYARRVDYVSGACLMLPTKLARQLGGFSEDFLPCYCEDSDLCLMVQEVGYYVYYNPSATIVHHLSKTTDAIDTGFKLRCISKNLVTLQQKWQNRLESSSVPKVIAFYLPQFHPIPENDKWWGSGFTEWANVTKARPNFLGHYQPRIPADLGYYDLRLPEIMVQQTELADRYGLEGFCFYYYWFDGKRLLDRPIEQMLESGKPDFPFCLCWANENWTRRWDGQDHEVLIAQAHSSEDDKAGIMDLIRYFRDVRYIKIDGRPLILVYRVALFPNFLETAALWRTICLEQGIGEIYIAMVESMEMVHANKHPKDYGCDAAVEFPPHGLADQKIPTGEIINPDFVGNVADYRDLAVRYATREVPAYTRFMGVIPGWDNTARRQNNSFCFEHATPGAFQAWLEETLEQTRMQQYGDERLIFVNAWNEWAEGAYLEPDRRFGHTYLEALKNALEAARLLRKDKYGLGD